MNRILPFFFAILLLSASVSCKKKAVPAKSEATGPAPAPVALKVNVQNTEFTAFSARGRMQLEKPDEKLASSVSIRIKKDSMIWISVVPALGIEVARVRITPDTIQVLDRLHKEYMAGNFALLQKRYNIAANFQMLQALLLGNYLPGQPGFEKEMVNGQLQQIRQERNNLTFDQFINPETRKLTSLEITDNKTRDIMNVVYNEFEQQENNSFATAILMTLNRASSPDPQSKHAVVSVKYNKFQLNDPNISFPFTVPDEYKRR